MHRLPFLTCALILSALVTAVWTGLARTEAREPAFASLIAIRDDATTTPFVYRRLLVDTADIVAQAWPTTALGWLQSTLSSHPIAEQVVYGYLKWPVHELHFFASATLLIWLSTATVMLTSRAIVEQLFTGSRLAIELASLVPGIALAGVACAGTWHLYPYDIPQAAVFSIGLLLALRGSPMLAPWMLVASYSKETSVLLLLAAWLVWPDDRRRQMWLVIALGFVAWAGVQGYVRHEYQGKGNIAFWKLKRNAAMTLYFLVAWSWLWPIMLIGALRVMRHTAGLPHELRRLLGLAVPLLVAAVFKGWVEELRQYSELVIPLGLCVYHSLICEVGLAGHLDLRTAVATAAKERSSGASLVVSS